MQHTSPMAMPSLKRVFTFALAFLLSGLMAFTLLLSVPQSAYAVTAAEKQAEAEEALANLNAMQETLDKLSADYGEALAAQAEAEEKRDAAEVRIGEIEERIDELQGRLGERAREMYRSGGISFLEILLDSATFEDFATSWDMLNKVNENDANMVQEQKDLRIEAEEQHDILTEQAEIAAQKSEEAAAAEAQAEETVAEMQATYDSLSEEAAELLEEERKAQEAAEAARAAAAVQASADAAAAAAAANNDNGGDNGGGGGSAYNADEDTTPVQAYEGGSDVVSRAYACLGAPYVWGGVGPYGYDCSGLVSYCLSGQHIRLGTTYTFMGWRQVSDPQPGDICVNWGHTGIYIGGGQMIHAATYGVGVIIGPVQSGMIIVRY